MPTNSQHRTLYIPEYDIIQYMWLCYIVGGKWWTSHDSSESGRQKLQEIGFPIEWDALERKSASEFEAKEQMGCHPSLHGGLSRGSYMN